MRGSAPPVPLVAASVSGMPLQKSWGFRDSKPFLLSSVFSHSGHQWFLCRGRTFTLCPGNHNDSNIICLPSQLCIECPTQYICVFTTAIYQVGVLCRGDPKRLWGRSICTLFSLYSQWLVYACCLKNTQSALLRECPWSNLCSVTHPLCGKLAFKPRTFCIQNLYVFY